jgi:hypothetical protein
MPIRPLCELPARAAKAVRARAATHSQVEGNLNVTAQMLEPREARVAAAVAKVVLRKASQAAARGARW